MMYLTLHSDATIYMLYNGIVYIVTNIQYYINLVKCHYMIYRQRVPNHFFEDFKILPLIVFSRN